jgi:hypothetical protein
MNARCAGIISRYWAQRGVVLEVTCGKGMALRSNLQGNGLPPVIAA